MGKKKDAFEAKKVSLFARERENPRERSIDESMG